MSVNGEVDVDNFPTNPGTEPLADFLSTMNNAVGVVSGSHQGVTTTELSGSNLLEDAVNSQFTAQDGGYVARIALM